MRVAFRVDASPRMGTGHLHRCLSLAQALRSYGAEVLFVTRDHNIDSPALIDSHGFESTIILPPPSDELTPDPAIPHSPWAGVEQEQDIDETVSALNKFSPDWVVIDSYAFDARWHNAVRDRLECRIAEIDDLADRPIAPDLLIDHNFTKDHGAKYASCLERKTRILGGPRYALLGSAFAEAERYRFNDTVRSIGVFMGGVDAGNHSSSVLDALATTGFAGAVEIVTTSANPNLDALRQHVANRPETTLSVNLPDLAEFFARHDIQIGAGGGATWERACIGVPTVLVVVAPNQMSVAPDMSEAGVVALTADSSGQAIAQAVKPLLSDSGYRRALGERARELVDGRGAQRAALAILADTLSLREAHDADMSLLFNWRNHPANRSVSRESSELDLEAHRQWFARALGDPKRKLFVGMIGERPVGVIRFDFSSGTRAEVSLYLDPDLHGIGLGPHLLLAGEKASGATTVDAVVLGDNRPSQTLFERCGYERQSPETWVKHLPSA